MIIICTGKVYDCEVISLFNNKERNCVNFTDWKFPAGEVGLKFEESGINKITLSRDEYITILWKFECVEEIFKCSLIVDAIRRLADKKIHLVIPYFPFARQDRCMEKGDSFSLQIFSKMIKDMNFYKITTWDAHSDVVAGMFGYEFEVIAQQDVFFREQVYNSKIIFIDKNEYACLVSPDSGASKKIYKLAKKMRLPVLECGKIRDITNGKIVACTINNSTIDISKYNDFIIIDDICDGGASFIAIAEEFEKIRKNTKEYLHLYVTHGIFSKGKDLLNKYFKSVQCSFDLSVK